MTTKAAIRAEAARLMAAFQAAGAEPFEADILQPAETLLDLYGEDIRARAYVTTDPLRGETMLRPDFTVPLVQAHMASGRDAARYAYAGEVFRRQEDAPDRPREYLQVGFEDFGDTDAVDADARVFALFHDLLAPLNLRAATGDIALLMAAVRGLKTTERRKVALLRHIWHPRRFRKLIERFSGKAPVSPSRKALLAGAGIGDAPAIGKRSRAEVEARIEALREDAATPPIGAGEVALLNDIFDLRETLPNVVSHLEDLAIDMPAIRPEVGRLAARAEALAARGIEVGALGFEASYGRTSMEYYDGFVFGFYATGRSDVPPVAQGGRYDALTRGMGRELAAVGGMIRPAVTLELAR